MPARPRALRPVALISPRIAPHLTRAAIATLALLSGSLPSRAQQLSEAPQRELALASLPPETSPGQPPPARPLTLREQFVLQTKTSFAPFAFVLPASETGIIMAHPPDHYPRDWRDGGGAFARNYGSEFGRHVVGGYTHFAVAAVLHEDPRYSPSTSTKVPVRLFHALAFTLVDQTQSGHRTVAFSNLAGSAAAGFVCVLWSPDGFDDTTHAYQRALLELPHFGGHNLIEEFSPEIRRMLIKTHLSHAEPAVLVPPGDTMPPSKP